MPGRATWGAIVASLAALAAAIALALPASAAAVPRSFYGISSQTSLSSADFDRMGQGKVGTLRATMSWAGSDPSKAAGDYNWLAFDGLVSEAARNGVRILPFVYSTPDWVARGLDNRNCGGKCATFAPRRKKALRAWRTFVGDAVARYGRGGDFWDEHPNIPQKPIQAWQIWNEMNSKVFYRPKPSVRGYAKLLENAAKAVRANDKRADIVLGGMAELAGSNKAVSGSKYLQKLYRRPGIKRDFDGVALHPYGARLNKIRQQVGLFRGVMKRAHDRGADLWVTELGWGSEKGGNPLNRGRQGQATRLTQAFRYFKSHRGRLNVKAVVWFSWMDSPTSICDWCASSGLFAPGLDPKPAWRAFTKLTGGS